jgi:hypothetical protein
VAGSAIETRPAERGVGAPDRVAACLHWRAGMNHVSPFAFACLVATACSSSVGADETASVSDSKSNEDVAETTSALAADPCVDAARWTIRGEVAIDRDNHGRAWRRDVSGVERTQADAQAYCASLGDWRLPTVQELQSLVLHPIGLGAHGTTCEPSIDARAFPRTPSDAFWSATTRMDGDAVVGLYTGFDDGRTHPAPPETPMYVRCVRGE